MIWIIKITGETILQPPSTMIISVQSKMMEIQSKELWSSLWACNSSDATQGSESGLLYQCCGVDSHGYSRKMSIFALTS